MTEKKSKDHIQCSFCHKEQTEVKKIVASDGVYICNECIELCYEIIKQDEISKDKPIIENGRVPSPKEIKEFLDKYVIGQEYAKMVISVAVNKHYKRLENPIIDDVEIEKSNIILSGPSGVGKTLIAKSIARLLDVPFYIGDATSLTEAGYVGDDVETIMTGLLQNADQDIEKAQRGIVYIDEIDKKGTKSGSASVTRDVSGEGVQQALLKIIEGTVVRVPPQGGRKHPQQEMIELNTENILFIVGGAFVGLDKLVQKRLDKDYSVIGFGSKIKSKDNEKDVGKILEKVEPDDLIQFGLIPELIGRLPVHAALSELTEEELVRILVEPKNAIVKQFKSMFKLDKVELDITQEALEEVAKISKQRKTGARGLRSVIENSLMKLQYELPDLSAKGINRITIDKDVISGVGDPKTFYEEKLDAGNE